MGFRGGQGGLGGTGLLPAPASESIDLGDAAGQGIANNIALSDHRHPVPGPNAAAADLAAAASIGVSSRPATQDHVHRHRAVDHASGGFADLSGTFLATAYVFDNVKARGAVGDGVTDDTAAVQASINAVHAAGSGVVWLPVGTYLVGQLTLFDNVKLLGPGLRTTTLKLKNATNASLLTGAAGLAGVELDGFTIDGNKANNASTNAHGVSLASPDRFLARRVRVKDSGGDSIYLSGTPVECAIRESVSENADGFEGFRADTGTIIDANIVKGLTRAGAKGILAGTHCQVIRNRLTQTSGSATAIRASTGSIVAENWCSYTGVANTVITTDYNSTDVQVRGNYVVGGTAGIHVGAGGRGSNPVAASRTVVANNVVLGGQIADAILFGVDATTDTGTDNAAIGNIVSGTLYSGGGNFGLGIETQLQRTTIVGNTVTTCAGQGIGVYSKFNTVTGNTVAKCATAATGGGIKVAESYNTVTGNTCIDNGSATYPGAGILVQAAVDAVAIVEVDIIGNRCGDTRAGAARTQSWGVKSATFGASATADHVNVIGNNLKGNVTAPTSLVGANNTSASNVGVEL